MLLLSSNKSNVKVNYSNLYDFFRLREKRFPIQSYIDILMYDSICRCSTNVIEYELLKQKSRTISGLLQAQFDLKTASIKL